MNNFFQHWVDLTAMVISLVAAIFFAIKLARKHPVKGLAAFFFLFGPLVILVHMFFHLFNISYTIAQRVQAHTFVYDYRTYSLYLMGGLLAYLSFQLLQHGLRKCNALQSSNKPIFKTMLAIGLVSLPTVFFTPIGSLPAMACIISLAALAFLKRKTPFGAETTILQYKADKAVV